MIKTNILNMTFKKIITLLRSFETVAGKKIFMIMYSPRMNVVLKPAPLNLNFKILNLFSLFFLATTTTTLYSLK